MQHCCIFKTYKPESQRANGEKPLTTFQKNFVGRTQPLNIGCQLLTVEGKDLLYSDHLGGGNELLIQKT